VPHRLSWILIRWKRKFKISGLPQASLFASLK
jgi:hypothetical protein